MGILLDFNDFKFNTENADHSVSSLHEYLTYLNKECQFQGYVEHHNSIATDICNGIAYLHQANVVHMDLTPHNVVGSNTQSADRKVIAKLTDFGEKWTELVNEYIQQQSPNSSVDISKGTFFYNAPEVHKQYDIDTLR